MSGWLKPFRWVFRGGIGVLSVYFIVPVQMAGLLEWFVRTVVSGFAVTSFGLSRRIVPRLFDRKKDYDH